VVAALAERPRLVIGRLPAADQARAIAIAQVVRDRIRARIGRSGGRSQHRHDCEERPHVRSVTQRPRACKRGLLTVAYAHGLVDSRLAPVVGNRDTAPWSPAWLHQLAAGSAPPSSSPLSE